MYHNAWVPKMEVTRRITAPAEKMKKPITGYHKDKEGHWVAELACGHNRHVRHDPPWQLNPWVITGEGRKARIGEKLECKKCDRREPRDRPEGTY